MNAQMQGSVLTRDEHTTTDQPGDAAHIVFVPEDADTTAHALVLEARIYGFEVEALCGYRWVPGKDAKALPVCEKCLTIYQQDGDHRDEREELPDA